MKNIKYGNATVCATETGWILPGGRNINSAAQARMYAVRMDRLMRCES